jgi:hypothetical protein
MIGLLRVAFVNTSDNTPVTIHVETQDSVECCQLLTTTPAMAPEANPGKTYPPGGWDLVVPAGTIFGFVTEKSVKITNPNPATITTIYANGKDPWPLPPPLSPLSSVPDFATRYKSFLMTGALPDPRQHPVVMTLAPAHTTP